jgi:hypothetical protein
MNLHALAVVTAASVAVILFVVCSIIPDFEGIQICVSPYHSRDC